MAGLLILIAVIIIILGLSIRIVPQGSAYVVERLGRYQSTWNSGPHLLVPFIDTVRRRVLVKEQVADFAPQPVITKDNVTMQIDSVVYFNNRDLQWRTGMLYVDPKLTQKSSGNPYTTDNPCIQSKELLINEIETTKNRLKSLNLNKY